MHTLLKSLVSMLLKSMFRAIKLEIKQVAQKKKHNKINCEAVKEIGKQAFGKCFAVLYFRAVPSLLKSS